MLLKVGPAGAFDLQWVLSTVARWETGKTAPNASHIGEMCDFGRIASIEPGFFFPAFSRCNPGQDSVTAAVTPHARRVSHG